MSASDGVGCDVLQVLVMAKAPVAGRVKTRLCPPLSLGAAAAVARAALADTLDAVAACEADVKVLALDGSPGSWLPNGIEVIPQRGEGLDERLANAWTDTWPRCSGWGLQMGMDAPQVTSSEINSLLEILRRQRSGGGGQAGAILGHALDGGWWVIGLPGTDPHRVFRGVPISTSFTGRAQERRLRALGLDVWAAPTRRDIDTIEDLRAVAGEVPHSKSGAAARALLASMPPARESLVA